MRQQKTGIAHPSWAKRANAAAIFDKKIYLPTDKGQLCFFDDPFSD